MSVQTTTETRSPEQNFDTDRGMMVLLAVIVALATVGLFLVGA